jgi:hypothetical protein
MTSINPYLYRKVLIIAIDLLAIGWLIREISFSRGIDDFFGIFVFAFIAGILIFNVYAVLLVKFFFSKGRIRLYIEGFYVFLLLLPVMALWYFTH